MELTSASFAYPDLDGPSRAVVAESLAGSEPRQDVYVLSTCLRVEVAVPGDETRLKEILSELLGPLPADPIVRRDGEAATHLFRVAAGLESPIVGEIEILTQFRHALAELKQTGSFDGTFAKLIESAVATGREVRALLGHSPHDTMAAIAAQMVGSVEEAVVVGSGTMATAVTEALAALPAPPHIHVLARSPERVTVTGSAEVHGLGALPAMLRRAPALISATAADTGLLDDTDLSTALSARPDELLLVDMAMPPDFSPRSGDPVRYVSIDDLAALAWRRARTTEMDDHVAEAAADAHHRFAGHREVGPVIARLMDHADAVVADTVDRFSGRLTEPSDADTLRQAVHTAVRTVLARPVKAVTSSRDGRFVETIAAAFDDE